MLNINVETARKILQESSRNMRGSLVAMGLYDIENGKVIASMDSNEKAASEIGQITGGLQDAIKDANFAPLRDWYMMRLSGDIIMVVLRESDEFQGGMVVEGTKANLGLLMSVGIPQALKMMREARNTSR